MPAAIFTRLVLLEARRSGLPWLAAGAVAAGLAAAAFLSQVALTEGRELQASVLAAWLRACAVFLVTAQVASSTLREINDKGLELMLSLPLARSTQYLGRLAGFAACGAVLALLFSVPLMAWADPRAVALWGVSLAFEATLVAAATLFFSMTLAQLVPAIAASVGFYLLARSMAAIQAISAGPLAEATWAGGLARGAVDLVALLLPRLDSVTSTAWLLYGVPAAPQYAAALAGIALYALLLAAAGLFDFYRRNL